MANFFVGLGSDGADTSKDLVQFKCSTQYQASARRN